MLWPLHQCYIFSRRPDLFWTDPFSLPIVKTSQFFFDSFFLCKICLDWDTRRLELLDSLSHSHFRYSLFLLIIVPVDYRLSWLMNSNQESKICGRGEGSWRWLHYFSSSNDNHLPLYMAHATLYTADTFYSCRNLKYCICDRGETVC